MFEKIIERRSKIKIYLFTTIRILINNKIFLIFNCNLKITKFTGIYLKFEIRIYLIVL